MDPLQRGQTLNLNCSAKGNFNFTWTITASEGIPRAVIFGQSYSKQDMMESNAGNYTCAISDDLYYGEASVTVEVKPASSSTPSSEAFPDQTSQGVSQRVVVGGAVGGAILLLIIIMLNLLVLFTLTKRNIRQARGTELYTLSVLVSPCSL